MRQIGKISRKKLKKSKIKVLHQQYWVQVIIERKELIFDDIIEFLVIIKTEHINLHPIVNLDREIPASPSPPPPPAATSINNIEIRNSIGSFELSIDFDLINDFI
jgi:hypothetical protein